MAKARGKPEPKNRAKPLLAGALFCEKILYEKDNVASLIRVVDLLTVPKPQAPVGLPEKMKVAFATQIVAFIAFKSGEAKGEYDLQLTVVFPSGKRRKMKGVKMSFLGDENGFNAAITVPAPIEEEGLYWYEVRVEKKLFTRMPLRIAHSTPSPSEGSPESSPQSEKGK